MSRSEHNLVESRPGFGQRNVMANHVDWSMANRSSRFDSRYCYYRIYMWCTLLNKFANVI